MRSFLANIELWLSGVALLIILIVPAMFYSGQHDVWKITAITAIGVGTLHGIIFWLVRRRQRLVRNEAIGEIRAMLTDTVNNVVISTKANNSVIVVNTKEIWRK